MKRSRVALAVAFLAVGGASAAVVAPNASGSTPDRRTSTISGRAWTDSNGDGIRSTSEPGIEGVRVSLELVPERRIIKTLTTASDGRYSFGRLESNRCYRIRMTVPDGRVPTRRDEGSDVADSDLNAEGVVPRWICPGWGWYSPKNIDGGFAAAPTPSATVKLKAQFWWDANRSFTIDAGDPLAKNYPLALRCGATPVDSTNGDDATTVTYTWVGDRVEAELPRGAVCYWEWVQNAYGGALYPVGDDWRTDAATDMRSYHWRLIDTDPDGDVAADQVLASPVIGIFNFFAVGPLAANDADVTDDSFDVSRDAAVPGYSVRLRCNHGEPVEGGGPPVTIPDTVLWSGGDPYVLSAVDFGPGDVQCMATYASGPAALGEVEPGLFVYDRAPIEGIQHAGSASFVRAAEQPYVHLGVTLWQYSTFRPTFSKSVEHPDPWLVLAADTGISAG